MLRTCTRVLTFLIAIGLVPTGFASSLQDWEFNVNGSTYYPGKGSTFGSVSGLDASGFDSITGQGTLTLTFNPGAAGAYYVGAFFFIPISTPFYNEHGVVNNSPTAGQTWQIDVPEYDVSSANHGAGTIIDNLGNGTLNGMNSVPGATDNYLNGCGANGSAAANANCNDFVSMALGFNFNLTADQEEIVSLTLSPNGPTGFSLEAVHPVDGSNPAALDLFYSGAVSTQAAGTPGPPPSPNSPEPASAALVAGGFLVLAWKQRHGRINR